MLLSNEKKLQVLLDSLPENLNMKIEIIDLDLRIVASRREERIGEIIEFCHDKKQIQENKTWLHEDKMFYAICSNGRLKYHLVLNEINENTTYIADLTAKLIESSLSLTSKKLSRDECFRNILGGKIQKFDIEEALYDSNIELYTPRCVFVIQTPKQKQEIAFEIISEAFSNYHSDYLIKMDHQNIVLIKQLNDIAENDDLAQLADAIFETVYAEGTVKTVIGVGTIITNIADLRISYIEAHEAIKTGVIFNPEMNVHVHSKLLLERLVMQIPNEVTELFLEKYHSEDFAKLINTEIVTTVKHLFDNNLNLSEAARQLYIHRNTLVYRLDKIEKTLGLDLRNFHDAVAFRLIMMLKMLH